MFRVSMTSFPHRRCETRKPVRIPAHVLGESDRRKAALLGAFELLGDCRAPISPSRMHLEFDVHQFRLEIVELNEVLSHRGVAAQGAAVFLAKNCCSPTGSVGQRYAGKNEAEMARRPHFEFQRSFCRVNS